MPFYTPLRYPGGKRRLAGFVGRLLEYNGLRDVDYVEPYAGGCAVALALLFEERAAAVHVNDLSRPVYAFWRCVLEDTEELCRRILKVKLTMATWRRQRAIYERRATADLAELGFAALFLNRTNRSGIIGGGVIGGKAQSGSWGLDARFNREELVARIRRISRYRSRIHLYRSDAIEFTDDFASRLGKNVFVFYDPPYIHNGRGLYLNDYDVEAHRAVERRVLQLAQPWIVTYDHPATEEGLYRSQRRIEYDLSYSAGARYRGKEVLFLSDSLRLPTAWQVDVPFAMGLGRYGFDGVFLPSTSLRH